MQNLCGFLGASVHEAALRGWLASLSPPEDRSAREAASSHVEGVFGAGIAPGMGTSSDVVVLLRGQPYWQGGHETTGNDALAAQILSAYRDSGSGLLHRLHGSFAVAILDLANRRALLAIDRMGIERLAYAETAGGIVFSTSAEWVAKSPGREAALDPQAIFNYLFFHMIPSPDTVFRGVRKLPAATLLSFEAGRLRLERYWQPAMAEGSTGPAREFEEELHRSLRTAVACTRPGEHSGAFLSGGLDSSTVAGVLSKVSPSPAKTFSIGFGYPDYDELAYARIAARHFGCEAHEYTIAADDIARSLPMIAATYDEPFGNSSALPAYYCARFAREHGVDHLLAGDGGDEIFAGNSRYAEQQVFEWYARVPAVIRSAGIEGILRALPQSFNPWPVRKARGYVAKARIPLPARLEMWNFVVRLGAEEILDDDFRGSIDPSLPFSHMQAVWNETPSSATLNRMLFYDWRFTLADNDLRKVETMSQAAGVRVSYPMLHPDVVDLSCRIPPGLKMPRRQLRHFYKQAMGSFLPREIIDKKKHGFGLPFGLWLAESAELRSLVSDSLASLRARRMIQPRFIDRLLSLHGEEDARYYGVFIWVLAMLEMWLHEHHDR